EDVELLVGRETEAMEMCTVLESSDHGIYIVSGLPGVGKTSFFNITQYLLESSQAPCGPHVMCARTLCPIRPNDKPRDVAERALQSLLSSVEQYCHLSSRPVPPETQKLSQWIGGGGGAGFQLGITVLGVGGNFGKS